MERFYFDSQMGTCQKFYFGGCEGKKFIESEINMFMINYCYFRE